MKKFRIETDSMGKVRVPAWAYWGAQTQRAVDNFNISGVTLPFPVIRALGLIKRYACEANLDLRLLEERKAQAIIQASEEVIEGKWNEHFPVDIFQTGSGTSSNMNINEVIANRANELLGFPLGSNKPIHPNDDVNLGQSSNDVFPSAMHIAVRQELGLLIKSLTSLHRALLKKKEEFKDIVKVGRTHLQDAVPMTMGQEFSGYASQIEHNIRRIEKTFDSIEELALGGTAVGTGINTHPEFPKKVISKIKERTDIPFREADNRFEAISARDAMVELMGALNTLAVTLLKISNDIRLLSSGPRAGIGEIILPSLQPGSSIMPGKINPVIPEMIAQVSAQIMGNSVAVSIGGQNAPLEVNMMMPMIAYNVLFSTKILRNGTSAFAEKCISGIQVDEKRCQELVKKSLALATPLTAKIGYDRASKIVYKAYKENKSLRDVILEEGILEEEEIDKLLNPNRMLKMGNNNDL